MSDVLKMSRQNKVAVLTLNRPKMLNALSFELREELGAALRRRHGEVRDLPNTS